MSKQVLISQKGVTFLFGRKVTFLLGTNNYEPGLENARDVCYTLPKHFDLNVVERRRPATIKLKIGFDLIALVRLNARAGSWTTPD